MPAAELDVLVEVGFEPSGPFANIEALEPILAAAALDYSVAVLLHAPALALLRGEEGRRWQQLVDFELAEILSTANPDEDLNSFAIRSVQPAEVEQLRSNARTILTL